MKSIKGGFCLIILSFGLLISLLPGCEGELSDEELFEEAVKELEELESYRGESEVRLFLGEMGSQLPPISIESIYQEPHQLYVESVLWDADEDIKIELLTDGETLKYKKGSDQEVEEETIDETWLGDYERYNVDKHREMFIKTWGDYEVIDNPSGFEEGDYTTYQVEADQDKVTQFIDEEDFMSDFFMQMRDLEAMIEAEDVPEEEFEEYEDELYEFREEMEKMLESSLEEIDYQADYQFIVNREDAYTEKLIVDVVANIPYRIFMEEYLSVLEKVFGEEHREEEEHVEDLSELLEHFPETLEVDFTLDMDIQDHNEELELPVLE